MEHCLHWRQFHTICGWVAYCELAAFGATIKPGQLEELGCTQEKRKECFRRMELVMGMGKVPEPLTGMRRPAWPPGCGDELNRLSITEEELAEFWKSVLAETEVYAVAPGRYGTWDWSRVGPKAEGGERFLVGTTFGRNARRAAGSCKKFFFPVQRGVTPAPPAREEALPATRVPVLAGLRACDIAAFGVLDDVFEGEPADPFYVEARRRTLLVSMDCASPSATCFCTSLGGKPYPSAGFDLNLTPLAAGFVVEIGSPKGREFWMAHGGPGRALGAEHAAEQAALREKAAETVGEQCRLPAEPTRFEAVERTAAAPIWGELSGECVECHACAYNCPTCHCFVLRDFRIKEEPEARVTLWDSCLRTGFARVAGGANPRPETAKRLRHRYFHKFVYLPERSKVEGCTGCGRCVESCPGGLDIRRVLGDLLKTAGKGSELRAESKSV